jgi:hypothetical protein
MTLPAPTAINPTQRYIAPGTRRYVWVTTIANKNSPTSVELTAGKDLTAEVADVAGFTTTSNNVDAPDFGTRFTSKVPGMITADDSSITLYQSKDSDDIRSVIMRDDTGFVVIFPEGISATGTMDVFPVSVSTKAKQQSQADPAQIQIQFTITSEPVEDLAVPSA